MVLTCVALNGVWSLRVYGLHMCVVVNGVWSLRVYSTEEKALVFPDDPVVELLGQFGVLVDEPGLPQHISRSTLQLHTQTTHDKLRRHQHSSSLLVSICSKKQLFFF